MTADLPALGLRWAHLVTRVARARGWPCELDSVPAGWACFVSLRVAERWPLSGPQPNLQSLGVCLLCGQQDRVGDHRGSLRLSPRPSLTTGSLKAENLPGFSQRE